MSSTINASVDGIVLTASSTAAMNLATGGTNRLSIDTSGNVGISTGNLSFSATGQRITGDFSNATASNRLLFQTSTTNGNSFVGNMPNGTGSYGAYISYNGSDPANSSSFLQGITSTDARLVSTAAGTGSLLPLTFYTGGSERMRLDTSGNLGIGGTPSQKLSVIGGRTRLQANNETYSLQLEYGSGTGQYYIGATNSATPDLVFSNVFGSEAMRVTNTGNVGIGTASPDQRVTINSANTSTNSLVSFKQAGTTYAYVGMGSDNRLRLEAVSTDVGIQADSANVIFFNTNGSERMRITSGGNVGIGVDPGAANIRLYVKGANQTAGQYTIAAQDGSGNNAFVVENNSNVGVGRTPAASTRFTVKSSNNGSGTFAVYVENTTPTELFKIRDDGVFYTGLAGNSPYNLTTGSAANLFVDTDGALRRSTSSLRYKSDVTNATHGLADVLKLRSVTYKGINDGNKVFGGLIAEEVHDAGLTEFVAYDNEGRPDALHYGNMVALAFKAIQELKAENDALKARIEELETK